MLDPDALSPDDERLLPLAIAIADGSPVEWSVVPSSGPTSAPSGEPGDSESVLGRLRQLERLVRGHEAVRSRIGRAATAAAHETLLTEARRTGRAPVGAPLRVQWGPLVVLEKIGRGSFGDVYRAWDPRLDREVALKLIPEDTSETVSSPVVEEGCLLARVRHPNVLTVHGAERIDGRVGIWTEYVRGETLAQEVARRGPLPPEEAARIGAEVCAALGAVHAAGLLHRDVKAQNVMRDAGGRIVVGDFGTGVEIDEDVGVSEPRIAGTPLYLAPEVLDGKPATVRSDLYSVGVLLHFLVSGDHPVRGRSLGEIREAHRQGRRTPTRASRPDLPTSLLMTIERALDTDPAKRFETAAAMESALTVERSHATRPTAMAGARLIFGAVAAILAMVIVGATVWRNAPSVEPPVAPLRFNAGDWIMVGRFENQTGEEVLDGTIEAAIKRELEYSEFIRVAQRDRVEDSLRSLGRPLNSRLDATLARNVAVHDGGIRALVGGGVIRTAGAYGITINLLNPSDGTQVARLTDTARRPEEILTVVRRQTLRLRESLGEPSATVERSRAILSRTWLPSIKALHLYTQAVTTINLRDSVPLMRAMPDRPLNGNDWAALEQLGREAVHEDPTFARAAVMLAYTIANQGRPREEFLPYAERALALAETATPQERYFILASFHQLRGGGANRPRTPEEREDLEKAVTAYESLFALQPDHYDLANNLRFAYSYLGRDRDRAWMDLRIAEARPRSVEENLGVANRMLREGNWDGARRFGGRAAAALSPASTAADPTQAATARLFDAYVAWLQDDPRSALSVVERVAATADRLRDADRDAFRTRLWPLYVALGRLRDAERTTDAMRRADGNDSVDTLLGEMAQAHVLWDRGDTTRFRELVGRWGEPLPPDFPPALSGRIESLIRAGFYENAERDLEQFKRRMQLVRLADGIAANFSAALERARGRPDAAIALFRKARTLAAYPERFLTNGQGQYYSSELASALETTGRLSEAIAVLEEAGADRVGIVIENALGRWLRGRAQLVRLYRKSGQVDEARGVEDQLLKLLAVADADHPLVAELKARRVADVAIVRSSRSTIK